MRSAILLVTILFSTLSLANEYQLGVILGYPTGISGKVDLGNNRSVDGALAYSLDNKYGFHVHADYLVENFKSINVNGLNPLEVYYGIGGYLTGIREGKDTDKTGIGARAPLGIEYNLSNPNLQIFAEVALAFDLIPSTDFNLHGGIGIRYKF